MYSYCFCLVVENSDFAKQKALPAYESRGIQTHRGINGCLRVLGSICAWNSISGCATSSTAAAIFVVPAPPSEWVPKASALVAFPLPFFMLLQAQVLMAQKRL